MEIGKGIKVAQEGLWVKWRDGAEVLLRMSPRLLKELYRKASPEVDGKEEFDELIYEQLLTEQVIVDWRGIVNNGVEFPCTLENKKIMMDCVMEFATWISTTCLNLEKAEEAEVKNS